jgi:hypothetical protein
MNRPKRSPALVVSVTGHRNLGRTSRKVVRCVASECIRLREKYPTRKFVVVSPLAEGADRVVARIAVDLLDARLIVPIPLPLDDPHGYLKDFPQSIKEFKSMLGKADEIFLAPLRSRGARWRGDDEARQKQYAWVGAYVAEHADILFAIWDGKPARGLGGTAQVVSWFLGGHVPRAHSTLASSRQAGPLAGGTPMLLIHINPETGQVQRPPAGRPLSKRSHAKQT